MSELTYHPPLAAKPAEGSFMQQIHLVEKGRLIGQAAWHMHSADSHGVAQLLWISVDPSHRRKGQGRRLLQECIAQSTQWMDKNHTRLRRMWVMVQHKEQIIARAFLTSHGFHHVGTVGNLFDKQDALVYTRAFD